MGRITVLDVADPAELWRDLGFSTEGSSCLIAGTAIRLGRAGEGVTGWGLSGVPDLGELPLAPLDKEPPVGLVTEHPNGVTSIDHVVVSTPNLQRTVEAFEEAGVALRRTRDAGTTERPIIQAFFKLGDVVVEVVGSPGGTGAGTARFYGLAFTVADLDATGRLLGARLGPTRAAVQPGRRIATLGRAAGSTVPIAFMSPPPGRGGTGA